MSSTPADTPLPPAVAAPRRRPGPATPGAGRAAPRLPAAGWNETRDDATGVPRAGYGPLLGRLDGLSAADRRSLDERLEATMRELGVSFDPAPGRSFSPQKPWLCDALPQLFTDGEWDRLALGLRQRLRAFEGFLQDVYVGKQEILRAGVVPIPLVLGSASFQRPAVGLVPPLGAFLHAGSMNVRRDGRGELLVASHHFAQSNGLACMVQNRRVLARVAPELFGGYAVASLAETPTLLLETLREAAADLADDAAHGHQPPGAEPTVVLLTPGPLNPFYAEHGFLARRMGVPLVQGGDLLVLDDCLYLKTISGLERVHVVLNRVADGLLDPLVLQRGSLLGVPGLVHCLRKKTVALANGLGARLTDDRSLLPFAHQIIRFYTGEAPILRTVPTFWLGDLDQREMVLADLGAYRVQTLVGERPMSGENALRQEIRRAPQGFVAQRAEPGARAVCYERGRRVERHQDHLLFALRRGGAHGFEVFPGALTRLASEGQAFPATGLGGGTKDTWVLEDAAPPAGHAATVDAHSALRGSPTAFHPLRPPPRRVTSRTAESLYWLGRYGERATHLAYLLQAVETLETEELNAAERRLYRPMWNKLLPHLDASPRRSISTARDRYRLVLEPGEPGALVNVLRRTLGNAEGIQDTVSPEAWGALGELRAAFARQHFFAGAAEPVCARVTRKLAEMTTRNFAQFYGLAESTMLDDDGWRFCRIGQQLERAIITANAALACADAFVEERGAPHESEIELSAFLRLLGTRDAYRRVFQMRAEGLPVLQLLFQHPEAPRSVLHCLRRCADFLRACCPGDPAAFTLRPLAAVERVCDTLRRVDWPRAFEPDRPESEGPTALIRRLLGETMDLHNALADSFLNHQAQLSAPPQMFLAGMQGGGGN